MRSAILFAVSLAILAAQPKPSRPDVVYVTRGAHALKLDLFLPAAGNGPFPAILFVHGGGWKGGNKTQFHRHAEHMAKLGYVGACIEYRFSQEAIWPAAIEDVEAALAWLKSHAGELKVDPARIAAAGGSAGGQLVAVLGVRGAVKAVAAFNPAVDLIELAGTAKTDNSVWQYLGGKYADKTDAYRGASPALHVSAKSAPFLFVHGNADTTVPYSQSVKMRDRLIAAGVRAELFTGENVGHGFFNRDPWYQPSLERMVKFMADSLR